MNGILADPDCPSTHDVCCVPITTLTIVENFARQDTLRTARYQRIFPQTPAMKTAYAHFETKLATALRTAPRANRTQILRTVGGFLLDRVDVEDALKEGARASLRAGNPLGPSTLSSLEKARKGADDQYLELLEIDGLKDLSEDAQQVFLRARALSALLLASESFDSPDKTVQVIYEALWSAPPGDEILALVERDLVGINYAR